jgi:hypothetical protein
MKALFNAPLIGTLGRVQSFFGARSLLTAAFAVGLATQAQATVVVGPNSIQFGFDEEYSGATAPDGLAPWFTATFDSLGSNVVRLTLDAPVATATTGGLTSPEKITTVLFNLNPALSPANLSFSNLAITGSIGFTLADVGKAGNYAAAGNYSPFEMLLNFPTSGNTFDGGEKVVFDITYTGPVSFSAADFNFSAPGPGGNPDPAALLAAAHIQSTGADNRGSGWVHPTMNVVPEPGSMAGLMGLLAGGAFLRSRRRPTA